MSRRIALIVGVSQYDKTRTGLDSLAAPVNDAQRVYEVLAEYGGFDELYPLPLAKGKVDRSGWVTAQELRAKLHEVLNPQLADEVELAVFYFSGHGVNPDGQVAYLSASDKPLAVAISHIAKLAKHSVVKNICIWLDCCHSGEMLEFSDLTDKGFCVVAASHADGEALAADGNSLLTNLLCEALTPLNGNPPEIRVMDFIQTIAAKGKNLPQQVVCLARGNTAFTLTQFHGETTVTSAYPPDYPPYKGLLTFTKDDSPFFFGRDGMIQQLLDKLSASRFVPLLGASGSGKSSLVLAGLLPKLPESDWQVLVMRPTAQPLQNLRDTLVRGFPDAQVGSLASGADLQREVLRLVTAGKRLLLVIDQFEEVFTECRDDAARAAFFACLLEALDGDNPLHLVLTLRADFLGHSTEQAYSGLGQRLQHHALLLVAPTAGELREAITRPLALVGMRCEQALEDELIDQTLHAKGSLPLLQYVLEKLWQSARQERSRELTLAMYQQLGGQHGGGLRGVLNEKADAFYQQLEPQRQRLMEWLMVELTQVGDGLDDTRRTVILQELHNRQPQYTAALDALLTQLVTHERLLTQDHDDQGQATITVAHEALIRDWQRLREWLESNREIKSWRTRLEDSITAWKNKVSGSLLREKRLAEAQQILGKSPDSLLIGQDERAFIAASQAEAKRRKQLWVGSLLAFIVVLLMGITTTTWQWRETEQQRLTAEQQRQEANRQTKIALVGKLSSQSALAMSSHSEANGYTSQGLLLAIQAFRDDINSLFSQTALINSLQLAGQLRQIWHGHESSVNSVAFSPNGKYVVSGSRDKTLRLWNATTGQTIGKPWLGHEEDINAVAFSPDSKFVVSGSNDHTVRLWDVETGQAIGEPWFGHESFVDTVAFSPDGKYVVSGGDDFTVRLWDVATGQAIGKPWRFRNELVKTLTFSPDGKYVVSGGDTLRLWDTATGKTISAWQEQDRSYVDAVAFSPDGKYVVSGGDILQLWDTATGRTISTWQERGYALAVAFSPDGKLVVSGDVDKTLRLWDAATGQAKGEPWQGHEARVNSVAFSPDGKRVVSGSDDFTVLLWDVATGQTIGEQEDQFTGTTHIAFSLDSKHIVHGKNNIMQLQDAVTSQPIGEPWHGNGDVDKLAFNSDGKRVISISIDSATTFSGGLWDAVTGKSLGGWNQHEDVPTALAFSQNGKYLVCGIGRGDNSHLQMFNAVTGQSIGKPWHGHDDKVMVLAFSSDGKRVVSGSQDETLRLWNVATGQPIGEPWRGHNAWVSAVAFSPDNKQVISGAYDNTIRLWDVTTGQTIGMPWRGHDDSILGLAYSLDGKRVISGETPDDLAFSLNGKHVLSGGRKKNLRLWDALTGYPLGELWYEHEKEVTAVAFNPNSKHVRSGSEETHLHLFDTDPESWAKKACSIVNRNFSLAEWQRFIGDALPYQKTCPDLPAPGDDGWVEPYAGG